MRWSLLLLVFLAVAGCAPGNAGEAHSAETAATETTPVRNFTAARPEVGGWLPDPAARHGAGEGAPVPHHDGTRLLVVAREGQGHFVVFEEDAATGARRIAIRHDGDCGRAAYLPDDRIVYSGTTAERSPLPGVASSWALFVADGLGGKGTRITFGAGLDADPFVLSDGRIVFTSWRPDTGRLGLFTAHPDGTGYAPFHLADAHIVLPVQDATTLDVFAWRTVDGKTAERVRIDWDAPLSHVTADTDTVVTLAPRRRPQGHLSSRNEEHPWATIVCVDARFGRGAVAAKAQSAVAARISEWGAGGRALGDVPLHEDGSFMADVPVDMPLAVTLVDSAGATVAAEQGPFWVRNNEARVCVGCHDDDETAPPNRRPAAVLADPVDLTGGHR